MAGLILCGCCSRLRGLIGVLWLIITRLGDPMDSIKSNALLHILE